jgi:CheY-like chemotaxis protein
MRTDPVRLEQVVWNLINNAVQATANGGRVEVNYQTLGTTLCVKVRDWGRGIGPDDLPHIFEPFRQGPRGESSHRGLGLGLAITRSIVDLFGGDLQGYSDGVGQGATFSLLLPMVAAEHVNGPKIGVGLDKEDQERLSQMRVLYAEDEPDIGEGVRITLSELGAQVDLCSNFQAAKDRILAGGFDVLMSDLNLGDGHTALELIEVLRTSRQEGAIPAIVLSAYGSSDDCNASLRAGFAMHLVKPVEAVDVARALIDVVSGRRIQ